MVKGYTDLAMYEDAYASLMSNSYEKLHAALVCYFTMFTRKWDCVSQLTYWMCKDNALEMLMPFSFTGVADKVGMHLLSRHRMWIHMLGHTTRESSTFGIHIGEITKVV